MRGNLAEIAVIDALAAFQIDVGACGIHPFPRFDFDSAQIANRIVDFIEQFSAGLEWICAMLDQLAGRLVVLEHDVADKRQ